MTPEQRLGVAFHSVTHRGVPAATAVDRLAPGDRMVGAHLAAGIARLVERRQDVDGAARLAAEVVPFVGALPDCRQVPRRRMGLILNVDRSGLDLGVAREIGADEPPIPSPLILGVARRVYTDETPA